MVEALNMLSLVFVGAHKSNIKVERGGLRPWIERLIDESFATSSIFLIH